MRQFGRRGRGRGGCGAGGEIGIGGLRLLLGARHESCSPLAHWLDAKSGAVVVVPFCPGDANAGW